MLLTTSRYRQDTKRPVVAMSTPDSECLSVWEADDDGEEQHSLFDALAEASEEQPALLGCEKNVETASKEKDTFSSYWDVAMGNESAVQSGDKTEDECSEEDFLEDIVLRFESEAEGEKWRDFFAREDAVFGSLLPPPARHACSYGNFPSPTVIGRRDSGFQHHVEKRQFSGSCASNEEAGNHLNGQMGTSGTERSDAPSCTPAAERCSGRGPPSRLGRVSWSKHAAAAITRSGTAPLSVPLAFTKKGLTDGNATSSRKRDGAGATAARRKLSPVVLKRSSEQKDHPFPAAAAVRSTAFLRRSCSSPLPPMDSPIEQPPPRGMCAAAAKKRLSTSYSPKLQQESDSKHSKQGRSSTCAASTTSGNWSRCSEVCLSMAQQKTSTNSAERIEEGQLHRTQKPVGHGNQLAVARSSWSSWWNTTTFSCSRRLASPSLCDCDPGSGDSPSCGTTRVNSSKSRCHSFSMECRRMAFVFFFMLLSLAGELLLLRLPGEYVPAPDAPGSRTAAAAPSSDGSNSDVQQREVPLVPGLEEDTIDSLSSEEQAAAIAAAGNAVTARGLWLAANIVYVLLLGSSLLRFFLFMSPSFAPVVFIRLMICVSAAFLSHGLWVCCSGLEASAWHLRASGSNSPGGRSYRCGTGILCSIIDACGIWAFAPEASVNSVYHARQPFVATGNLFCQSLILSILVCFWAIYTSKRFIIAYLLVPAVATLIWALRIGAVYLSAAAATAAATTSDVDTVVILFYFPAEEATPCLLIVCFVLLYHLTIEAAVQKHLQYACRSSKMNPAVLPLRALFDRCFPCGLLQELLASVESLSSRIDNALCFPPSTASEHSEKGQEPHVRARRDTAASANVRRAPLHTSSVSHVSVSVALNPSASPALLAFPSPLLLSTTSGTGRTAPVAYELRGKELRRGRSSRDTMPARQDPQHKEFKPPRDKTDGDFSDWRRSNACRINGCSNSGTVCCIDNSNNIVSKANNKFWENSMKMPNVDLGLLKQQALPCVLHSSVVEINSMARSKGYPSSHPQSIGRGRIPSGFHSDADHDNNGEAFLYRVALAYAGSGDFDLRLFFSLVQQFMKMFQWQKPYGGAQNCR